MGRYEWTGARPFHDYLNDRVIEPGEVAEVDDEIAERFDAFSPAESTDDDVTLGVEAAEPPFDPGEYSVSELRDHFADFDEYTDEQLQALEAAERDGDNRATALDAIDGLR